MALRDTWHRALVYFGLAEDHEYHEPDLYEPETGTHQPVGYDQGRPAPRATVSRLGDRRRHASQRGSNAGPAQIGLPVGRNRIHA